MASVQLASRDRCVAVPIRTSTFAARIDVPAPLEPEVRSTFRDLLTDVVDPSAHVVAVSVAGGEVAITVDGLRWAPGPDQSVADQLMYVLMRASLDAEPGLLHLHGAYLSHRDGGVLLGGFPMSGKSTLTVRLVEAGFAYGTDERVAVDRDLRVRELMKPVSVVAGSFERLAHLDPALTGAGSASARIWHLPASAIRAGAVEEMAPVTVIAFLERRDTGSPEVTTIHPAEMARLLLSDSPDAVRFGSDAVTLTARLCASARCARIVHSDVDDVVSPMLGLVEAQDPVAPPAVIRLGTGSSTDAPHRSDVAGEAVLHLSEGVTSVLVGDRALLHRASSGEIVELDEVSTVWLQLLDGDQTLAQITAEVADANDVSPAAAMDIARDILRPLLDRDLLR